MSVSKDTAFSKLRYKHEPYQVLDTLNIGINSVNFMIVMWNKYQVFIYENFESLSNVFNPEYQIHSVLINNDYFLCVDINGFVHLTAINFEDPNKKIFYCIYQPKDQGIKACVKYSQNKCLSLKYESETYFLCLNRISLDYEELKKVALYSNDPWQLQDNSKDNYLIAHQSIDDHNSVLFKNMFKIGMLSRHCRFTVISFDRYTLYGCLFDPTIKEDNTCLIKLFSCPSEVCSIDILGFESTYLLIALKIGTVIRFSLNDLYENTAANINPEVVHLNSALHKLFIYNNTFVYTDGVTMWRADNVFTKNIKFKQFFMRNVKDFILYESGPEVNIICTTFTKLFYKIPFQDDKSYLKLMTEEYSSADMLLKSSDILHKIFENVQKSKELGDKLSVEGSYIAAMSLARHQEPMYQLITSSVSVCDSFEEVIKENKEELTFTEDMSQYVKPDVYLLLIKVKMHCDFQGLFEMVTSIIANSETQLHVTLSNKQNIIKTISIKASQINLLIPLALEHATEINVDISLIAIMPGTYDKKQKIWIELYKTNVKLKSEQFIRTNYQKSLLSIKGPKNDLEKSIVNINMCTHEFNFIDTKRLTTYVMYVRLPQDFARCNFKKHFTSKSRFLNEMLSSNEFFHSGSDISFMVGKERVVFAFENDGFSNPRMKIKSENLKVTASIRDYLADIVYGENACKPGEEFISIGFYTAVENLQRSVKDCIATSASSEVFAPLMEKFEKEVIAMLPV